MVIDITKPETNPLDWEVYTEDGETIITDAKSADTDRGVLMRYVKEINGMGQASYKMKDGKPVEKKTDMRFILFNIKTKERIKSWKGGEDGKGE